MKYKSNAKMNKPVESGTIFKGHTGKLDICVHKIIGADGLYLSCHRLGIEGKKLNSTSIMSAIKEAESVVKIELDMLNKDFNEILNSRIEISRY